MVDQVSSGFAKFETPEAAQPPTLPEGYEDWEGYKRANSSARENFVQVIRFPGSVFAAPGHYHDAQNLDKEYDAATDEIVPEGLYLIGTNYLTRTTAGGALLGATPIVHLDPLRKQRTKE